MVVTQAKWISVQCELVLAWRSSPGRCMLDEQSFTNEEVTGLRPSSPFPSGRSQKPSACRRAISALTTSDSCSMWRCVALLICVPGNCQEVVKLGIRAGRVSTHSAPLLYEPRTSKLRVVTRFEGSSFGHGWVASSALSSWLSAPRRGRHVPLKSSVQILRSNCS